MHVCFDVVEKKKVVKNKEINRRKSLNYGEEMQREQERKQ